MISIAMATYNGAKHLAEQLDSIFKQSVQVSEIIICDDCSTDDTEHVVKAFSERDNRIKFFRNKENLGFKKNFEKAISLCTGKYIALCDQDDIWLPHHIAWLVEHIEGKSLAVGNAALIDENGNQEELLLSETEQFSVFSENPIDVLEHILFCVNPFQGASMLFTRDFAHSLLPIPETVHFHDTWFAVNALCQNGIAYTFEPITFYRQADSTVTKHIKRGKLRHIKDRIVSIFTKKTYNTTRPALCAELVKRYSEAAFPEIKKVVEKSLLYHDTLQNGSHKLRTALLLIKDYKKIFATKSRKGCLSRVLRVCGI